MVTPIHLEPPIHHAAALAQASQAYVIILSAKASINDLEEALGNVLDHNSDLIPELALNGHICLLFGDALDAETLISDISASYLFRKPTSLKMTAEMVDQNGRLTRQKHYSPGPGGQEILLETENRQAA